MKLYVDLDGVLTNWDKQAEKALGMSFNRHLIKNGESRTWSKIRSQGIEFWSQMEWAEDGKELWNHILKYNPIILSAPLDKNSVIGKSAWIKREIGNNIEYILERNKTKYANEDSLLIDDLKKNVYPWIRAGGKAILHRNASDTIGRLKHFNL